VNVEKILFVATNLHHGFWKAKNASLPIANSPSNKNPRSKPGVLLSERGALLLLAALSALLSALTGLLVRLLVLLIRLLLAAALLTTALLSALLILLSALVWVVLGHSYLQFFESIACHHSTNLLKLSHIAASARDFKNKLDHGFRRVPFAQAMGTSRIP
jgi:hypothetical protein